MEAHKIKLSKVNQPSSVSPWEGRGRGEGKREWLVVTRVAEVNQKETGKYVG